MIGTGEWALLAAGALATGLVGGTISGLLGVGGGIVIVPVLEATLGYLGVDSAVRMPIAVATSLATIVPTSIASSRAHHRRGAVDLGLVKRWTPAIALGAVLGSLAGSHVEAHGNPTLDVAAAERGFDLKLRFGTRGSVDPPPLRVDPVAQRLPIDGVRLSQRGSEALVGHPGLQVHRRQFSQ